MKQIFNELRGLSMELLSALAYIGLLFAVAMLITR